MISSQFIGVVEDKNTFTVGKVFYSDAKEKAVLRATALGLYFAEINGKRVGDAYLTPGWTSYNKMLQVQEYDVTDYIRKGENNIVFTVNAGWYCGALVWDKRKNNYGEKPAVSAELQIGSKIIATDTTWQAKESFIRFSGIYEGETQDYTADIKPLTVYPISFDKKALVGQISEPVRTIERLPAISVFTTPNGETVYDFGQNLAGVVEVCVPENFSGEITLRFAEILIDGNFYTKNLRGAKATDKFIVNGKCTVSPEFTFHGFRYMKIDGAEIPKENVTALVRHTDMKRTGKIQTSNARFQRLLDNVVWGQRGNYIDIPTDCPQRDERLGWTGDANAFCATAAYNYDVRKFFKKWLADVRNDQAESGEIPHVVPDILGDKHTDAMWCDAITMIPWTLYEIYGDISFLSDNFEAMKKYLKAYEKTLENGLVVRGHQFGDWLALDGEMLIGNSVFGRTDRYFISSIFYSVSIKITADVAKLLGDRKSEREYREKYDKLISDIRKEYITENGRLAFDTVTAEVLALYFDIIPEKYRKSLAELLNQNVIKHGYRVTTGFIGTTYLLFALADNGYFDTAIRVLFNNGYPGWLYEVDMGATTIWERWNSLMPDGKPNPDGMNSYNHYAFGSVMGFVYRRIAGIETDGAGFKKVKISPVPVKGLPELNAEYKSINGKIVSSYKYKNGKVFYTIEIPDGVTGQIFLPGKGKVAEGSGKFQFETESKNLDAEPYTPESTVNEVFDNPKAVYAFNQVFGGIFVGSEIAWMRNDNKTLQFMAEFRDMEKKMRLADFPRMLQEANDIFKKTNI